MYGYDIMDYDKGIILAESLDEAKQIFKKKYPNEKITDCRIGNDEAEVWEIEDDLRKGLYCNVPW